MDWSYFIFFVLAVILVAQSSITIYTYQKNKTQQDSNYYFSVFTLVTAILGLLYSGYMMYKGRQGAASAVKSAITGQGDLLPPVDVAGLATKGTTQDVESLMSTIQQMGAQAKSKVDMEIETKGRALEALLKTVQQRMTSTAEAAAALGKSATLGAGAGPKPAV